MTAHDVVVIGAGHNGLVAGCYLARAGLDVVVIEAAVVPGGQSTSSELIAAAPGHLVNPCAMDLFFIQSTGIIENLELARHGLRLAPCDPTFCYLHDDGSTLAFWRDATRTVDEIRRFSRTDASTYLEFVRTLDAMLDILLPVMLTNPLRPEPRQVFRAASAVVRHRRQVKEVASLCFASAAEAVAERFRHEIVRGALAQMACAAIGPVTADGSGMSLITPAFVHRFGAARPIGGMRSLVDALVASLLAHGGSVRCGRAVREIVVGGNRAQGVVLEDGEVIRASRGVIASCDPRTALGSLLGDGALEPRMRAKVDFIPALAQGVAPFKVDVAVSERVTFPHHRRDDGLDLREPSLLIGDFDTLLRACTQSAAGRVPDEVNLWISTPTAIDPSQAPQGHDVLYLYSPVMPNTPGAPWAELADDVGNMLVSRAGDVLDGLEHELGRFVETPVSMAERARTAPGAEVFHVDLGLLRSGPLRPALGLGGARTPIENLYLGSGGSHPGPGVSGIPGRLAARELLHDDGSGARTWWSPARAVRLRSLRSVARPANHRPDGRLPATSGASRTVPQRSTPAR
jgi:phytoene dehydrogenase-like protein